ncbi:MAG: hypothetical protein PWP41_524 [Moorella sp. (in: firmicutes)]|nr:hypothetical protein [Moorella sp. (in: firmicutes)]
MGQADLSGKALKALQKYFSLQRERASIRATRLRVEKHLATLRQEMERDPALAVVLGADIKRLKQRQARLLCRELEAEEYCEYIEAALTAAGLGVEDRSMLVHRYRDNWTWTQIAGQACLDESTIRYRVRKALDKLEPWLGRRKQ